MMTKWRIYSSLSKETTAGPCPELGCGPHKCTHHRDFYRYKLGLLWLLAATLTLMIAVPAAAQTGENVLLIVNETSMASGQIGDAYARKRGVPATNVLHLSLPAGDQISRADYHLRIEAPIAAWVRKTASYD